jgi:hypothetical protein
MKNTRNEQTRQSKQGISHKPRPEIRDDMDSRKTKDILPEPNGTLKRSKKNY